MPVQGMSVWPPMPTEEEMTIPRLSSDGWIVEGWVKSPAGKAWEPEDGDLVWLPPTAQKSTDIDRAGSVVDVGPWTPDEGMAWVRAQLDKREKYLDTIRSRVRAGLFRMTAATLRAFGFDEDEIARLTGAELTPRNLPAFRSGVVGTYKAASDLQVMIDATGPARTTVDVKAIAAKAAEQFAASGDLAAAMDGILRAVRGQRAPFDPDTGLPIVAP